MDVKRKTTAEISDVVVVVGKKEKKDALPPIVRTQISFFYPKCGKNVKRHCQSHGIRVETQHLSACEVSIKS